MSGPSAVGIGSGGYGRSFSVIDAKLITSVCLISCPGYRIPSEGDGPGSTASGCTAQCME
jgi:hypothetical protein